MNLWATFILAILSLQAPGGAAVTGDQLEPLPLIMDPIDARERAGCGDVATRHEQAPA